MECEICGKETQEVKQISLEGSTLIVCTDCSSYGKELENEETAFIPAAPKRPVRPMRTIRPPRFEEEKLDLGLEIVPDYGKIIRKSREAKGLTVKELAMKIFEKESLLHRLENQSIKPSDDLIKKLEKQLGTGLKKKTE